MLNKYVDEIWEQYDRDESGVLNKKETLAFVKKRLGDGIFTEQGFDYVFTKMDADKSGTIKKHEMAAFIRKVAGLDTSEEEVKTNFDANINE